MTEPIFQQNVNNLRSAKGQAKIDFEAINSTIELQEMGLSLDFLLECMNLMKINDSEPLDLQKFKDSLDYAQNKAWENRIGFNELEGVNALVYDDKHDYLKDL